MGCDVSMMFDTPEGVAFVQMAARAGALKMEIAGFRRRGQSAYSICKQVYGLRGGREAVLRQMDELIEKAIAEKQAREAT